MTADLPTAHLFVRSLSPAGARTRPPETIERLERLVEAGALDDFDVSVWGREVECSSDVAGRVKEELVLERVAAFRSWAAERGVDLDAFERREVSTVTGETHAVLSLPVLALAEYVEGDLACVAPCTTGDGVLSVEDRLRALEGRGETSRSRGGRETAGEEHPVPARRYDAARP